MKINATFPKRRDGSFGSVTDGFGRNAKVYPINADGVADVPDDLAKRYVATGNFEYADAKDKIKVEQTQEALLIQNGDETIDLMALDREALLRLANEEMMLGLHTNTGEKKLREAIMKYVADSEATGAQDE